MQIQEFYPKDQNYTLYQHQRELLETSADKPYFAVFHQPGLGKTAALILNIAYLAANKKIGCAVVVAPPGVHVNWEGELKKYWPRHLISAKVFTWRTYTMRKREVQKAFENMLVPIETLRIFLLPNSMLASNMKQGTRTLTKLSPPLQKIFGVVQKTPTMLVIDESSDFKHEGSSRTKAMLQFAPYCAYRRILTGTPVTQSPFDLFSQSELLLRAGKLLGHSNIISMKGYYGVYEIRHYGPRAFKALVGFQNLEVLKQYVAKFSSVKTKEECLDLPPKIYSPVAVDMTDKQWKIYNDLRIQYISWLSNTEVVDATQALLRLYRLLQVTYGYTRTDEGHLVDLSLNRVESIIDKIEEIARPIIVYCADRWLQQKLYNTLAARIGADNIAPYFGSTSPKDKEDSLKRFHDGTARVFLASQQAAGYGLTLTEADTVMYTMNTFKLVERLQSEDRAHRIGQTSDKVLYLDFFVPDSVEQGQLDSLRGKLDMSNSIVPMIKSWLNFTR